MSLVSAKIAARRVDCAGLEIAGFEIGFQARQRSSCRLAARSGRSSISDVAKVRLANRRGSDHARSSLGPSWSILGWPTAPAGTRTNDHPQINLFRVAG